MRLLVKETCSVWDGSLFVLIYSCTEAEFWDVLETKVCKSFLLTIHSPPLLTIFIPPPPPSSSKSGLKLVCNVNILYGNLKSENSQDYAQKTQRNCTFMNSAAIQCTMLVYMYLYITDWMDRKQGVKINPFTDCLSL
jgi:hypothetical protein